MAFFPPIDDVRDSQEMSLIRNSDTNIACAIELVGKFVGSKVTFGVNRQGYHPYTVTWEVKFKTLEEMNREFPKRELTKEIPEEYKKEGCAVIAVRHHFSYIPESEKELLSSVKVLKEEFRTIEDSLNEVVPGSAHSIYCASTVSSPIKVPDYILIPNAKLHLLAQQLRELESSEDKSFYRQALEQCLKN